MPSSEARSRISMPSPALGDAYLAPPHWCAFISVLRTPRLYDGPLVLVDPYHDSRAAIPQVECRLRDTSGTLYNRAIDETRTEHTLEDNTITYEYLSAGNPD